ncbi:MAG: ArsR/SmtB family transcription factor [Candidatus Zixiibacteriota bacterium]
MPIAIRMNEKTFSKYFKAFGDPSRLKILQLLSSKEMTVGQIVRAVGLSQPTISRHLAILGEAEIVIRRREGQRVYYSLDKRAVESCCSGFCNCLAIRVEGAKKRKKS